MATRVAPSALHLEREGARSAGRSGPARGLSVTLPDRPGTLFTATDAIAKHGINIEGYCVVPTSGKEAILHFLTSDSSGARKALEGAGFPVREELEAFAVQIPDRPGALASVLRPIADAELNVEVTYSLADKRIAFAARDISQIRTAVQDAQATARS